MSWTLRRLRIALGAALLIGAVAAGGLVAPHIGLTPIGPDGGDRYGAETLTATPPAVPSARGARALPLAVESNTYYGGRNSRAMVAVAGAHLVLRTARTADGNGYLSSAVRSPDFRFGTVVVRAQLTAGTGLWPAIWLVPERSGPLGTPEIDLVELPQRSAADRFVGRFTYHWTDARGVPWSLGSTVDFPYDLTAAMHTYTLEWLPGSVTWWVDGREVMHVEPSAGRSSGVAIEDAGRTDAHRAVPGRIPIHSEPMHLIVNNAVGSPGSWAGTPGPATRFPNTMRVEAIFLRSRDGLVRAATGGSFRLPRVAAASGQPVRTTR